MNFNQNRCWRLARCLFAGLALFVFGFVAGQSQTIKIQLRSLLPGTHGLHVDASAISAASADVWLNKHAELVIVGDSIIAAGRWNEMFPLLSVHNRGIGGDTITGLLLRSDAIISKSPRHIIMMIGINDLTAGSSTKDIARQYDLVVQKFAAESHVTLLGILHCGPPRCGRLINDKITELNSAIAKIALRHHVQFVDFNPHFAARGQLNSRLTYDGVHLNSEGYRLMRDLLLPHLCKHSVLGSI